MHGFKGMFFLPWPTNSDLLQPKTAAAPKPAPVPATPQASSSTPAPPAAPQQSNTTLATSNPPATPSPAQPAQVGSAGPGFGDESAMMIGDRSASAIAEMEAMGFERADIDRALRAAFYNPDRAIDYLLSGIPDNIEAEQRAAREAQATAGQQAQTGQQATSAAPATSQLPTQDQEPEEVNLFDAAAQQAQGGARGAGRGAAAGAGAGLGNIAQALGGAGAGAGTGGQGTANMDFLRNNPHFQTLRQLVQQQPAMLEPILQQVAEGNPELAQMIGQNQEAFLQLLSEDLEHGGAPPPGTISVTQEEADAIERLMRLGFSRNAVIQAYFACDKNEELAANFLFEQPDEEEE